MVKRTFDRYIGERDGQVRRAVGPERNGRREVSAGCVFARADKMPDRRIVRVAFSGEAGAEPEGVEGSNAG
jgi:hypothetical protein